MARVRLTDRMLRNLSTERPQEDFYDEGFSGGSLLVRITRHGRRTFYFGYKAGRRNVRMSLGTYPAISLSEARKAAHELTARVAREEDPAQEKKQRKKAQQTAQGQTIEVLAEDYLRRHAIPRKKASSVREDRRIISTYLIPAWGSRPYHTIKKADVAELLDSIAIERGAPVMANRVRALVSTIFNFSIKKGLLPDEFPNPCGYIDQNKEQSRDRVLTDAEIRTLWEALENKAEQTATIYRLILSTCQRGGEVKRMRWDHLKDGIWTIPGHVAKNGRQHQVPLSTCSNSWIERLRPLMGDSEWVFPSGAKDGHLTYLQKANERLQKAVGFQFIPHDLRRTGATNLSKLGIDDVIIAKILNHKWADRQVTSIYNRDSRLPEMTVALERWGERLRQIVTGQRGTVVRMRS